MFAIIYNPQALWGLNLCENPAFKELSLKLHAALRGQGHDLLPLAPSPSSQGCLPPLLSTHAGERRREQRCGAAALGSARLSSA